MNTLLDTSTCGYLCMTLLHSLWQVALLAVIAKSVGLMAPQRMQLRYAVCVLALLVGLVALPATYMRISSTPHEPLAALEFAESSRPRMNSTESGSTIDFTQPVTRQGTETSFAPETVRHQNAADGPTPSRLWWPAMTVLISIAYFAGVAVMLARLARAALRVEKIRSTAEEIQTDSVGRLVEECSRRIGMTVVPRLAQSSTIAVPKVVGLIRPAVLLPTSAITGLTANELEMILTHELSHIQRHDLWVNCGQRIAESFLFFNPAAWYLSREISELREFCCDDLTCTAVTGRIRQPKIRYAEALLNTLELTQRDLDTESIAIAISGQGPSEIRRRVVRLLGEPVNDGLRQTRMSVAVILVVSALLFAIPQFAKSQTQDQAEASAESTADLPTETEKETPAYEPFVDTNQFVPDEADATVAKARLRTFDLQSFRKIGFVQRHRSFKIEPMQAYPDNNIESIWKARNGKFGKELLNDIQLTF
ncbi:MAG: M56 family metallopeptidase, partial [Planctomycetota bacterium]